MASREDKWLAVPGDVTFSVNKTAQGFQAGRQAALTGQPLTKYIEVAGSDADFSVGFIKGWMDVAVNASGEKALAASMLFWGTDDEALLEAVRDGLKDYGKTILEFCADAGIDLTNPSFDQLVRQFEALEAEFEAAEEELTAEDDEWDE